MNIYCCGCERKVLARLTSGKEIYPHREDLFALPFWICDGCKNYVGCHHKTKTPTRPLGNIPTKELREVRKKIHSVLDPLWKNKNFNRSAIYASLSTMLGYGFHTAEIKSVEEANKVLAYVEGLK